MSSACCMACQKPSPSYLRAQAWPIRCQIAACSRGSLSRLSGPVEQGQALVDLVAADGQLRRPPRPPDAPWRAARSACASRPGQARSRSSGTHRRGVVVRQQRRVLVLALRRSARATGRSRRAACARFALSRLCVGDLAGERVLDHVLPLTLDRRAGARQTKSRSCEQAEVRIRSLDELADRTAPEDAADHGGRLQRRLLGPGQQVDARGEHGLDGVRHRETRRELTERPAAVPPGEHAPVDQRRDQLLDEERVPLGPFGDQLSRIGPGQSLPAARRSAAPPPRPAAPRAGPAMPRPTGPSPAADRAARAARSRAAAAARAPARRASQQVAQLVLRPSAGPRPGPRPAAPRPAPARNPTHDVCSRSRTASGCMPSGGARPSVKPEPLAASDPLGGHVRRIALQDPEVLLQHLAERPVRDAVTVRRGTGRCAAAAAAVCPPSHRQNSRSEPRLADPGVADDSDQVRPAAR